MLIKVTEVSDIETKKEGKRRWKEIRIDYETENKTDNYKVLLDWANPDAYEEAQDCLEGQFYEVTLEKNGKYWNWTGIKKSDATGFDDKPASKSYSKSTPAGGNNWDIKNKLDADRFEFEKEKQGLIVRQSSINYALSFYAGRMPSLHAVLVLASTFEDQIIDGFVIPELPETKVTKRGTDVKQETAGFAATDDDDLPS